MTVKDLQDYLEKRQTIILPYGVVEQHGFHLPLNTDTIIAEAFAERIADSMDLAVAPAVRYCFSGGMLTGTINIKPNTFTLMMGEIIESLVLQGFKNIFIFPGHGGSESLEILKESLRILKWVNPSLHNTMIAMVLMWNYSDEFHNAYKLKDYHAGYVETSLMMHFRPELVKDEIIMDESEVSEMLRNDPDSYQLRRSFTSLPGEICNTSQRPEVKVGVMGYPERSSRELGKRLAETVVLNASKKLSEAVKQADEARNSGKMIEHKNPEMLKILEV
jgi:creatinine amidohydrolase